MAPNDLSSFLVTEFNPLPGAVREALSGGPAPGETALPFPDRDRLLESEASPLETGYARLPDGQLYVAVRHELPGVTCAMIDWWFAWHGTDERYRLWHPKDHKKACWKGPGPEPDSGKPYAFAGHTSFVEESLNGGEVLPLAIRFLRPEAFFSAGAWRRYAVEGRHRMAVCARSGPADRPVEAGHLVHLVHETPEGCVMRSRFWLGDMKVEGPGAPLGLLLNRPFVRKRMFPTNLGENLLVHCAQEMGHFASFLPRLYRAERPPRE